MSTVDIERVSTRTNNNEIIDNTQLQPPPYTTIIYKLSGNSFDNNPPPSYNDVDTHSVVYVNNYPGPPLTDGFVQTNEQQQVSTNQECIFSKTTLIYLKITGFITILLGIIAFDLQIVLVASKSILHYYYGFWGGAVLVAIGISTLALYKHRYIIDYNRLCHSFFCQMFINGIIFIISIVILTTDKCNDDGTESSSNNNNNNQTCENSNTILNGFLLAMFIIGFIQSIINTILFTSLKRKYSNNLH